jgi:arsenate reductase
LSCDSCRSARKWLDERDIAYNFHDLRKDGLDIQMLERWSDRLDWKKILNTQSLTWRKVPEADRENMSRSRALATMIERPTLVKRPILESKKLIAVGFSADRYAEIFKKS